MANFLSTAAPQSPIPMGANLNSPTGLFGDAIPVPIDCRFSQDEHVRYESNHQPQLSPRDHPEYYMATDDAAISAGYEQYKMPQSIVYASGTAHPSEATFTTEHRLVDAEQREPALHQVMRHDFGAGSLTANRVTESGRPSLTATPDLFW